MPVTKTSDNAAGLMSAVRHLLKSEVIVGIPGDGPSRRPEDGEKGTPPTNAVIGFAMEYGMPDKNVPARPFLIPGSASVRDQAAMLLAKAGEAALSGDPAAVERGLERVGLVAADAVRRQITDGFFAPLSERTIQARADRGRKGAKQYLKLRAEGTPDDILQGSGLLKPLIDSGQLRRAITSVVRSK